MEEQETANGNNQIEQKKVANLCELLGLYNLLQETIPYVVKNVIPQNYHDGKTFYQHVMDYHKKLRLDDLKNLKRLEKRKQIDKVFQRTDIPSLYHIITKVFKLPKTTLEALYLWKSIRNEIVHEGRDIVRFPSELADCIERTKEILRKLNVPEEVVEKAKNVTTIECTREEYDAFSEKIVKIQNYNKILRKQVEKMSGTLEDYVERQKINAKPFDGKNKNHMEIADKMVPVLKEGEKHNEYGVDFKTLENAYSFVNHDEFKLGGENSAVFLGYFKHIEDPWVAIKSFETLSNTDVPKESKILEELRQSSWEPHKNVIGYYRNRPDRLVSNQFYIVMPLCDFTLDEYVKREGMNISFEDRCSLAKDLLEGMVFLHKNEIFHRDLKPNNLLIKINTERKAVLKISDFDVSCQKGSVDLNNVGHWNWSSPREEKVAIDDVFSSCLILCYILLGYHPFKEITKKKKDLNDFYKKFKKFVNNGTLPDKSNRPLCKLYNSENISEDILEYIDKVLLYFFELYAFEEQQRNATNSQDTVPGNQIANQLQETESTKAKRDRLEGELDICKIQQDITSQIYSMKYTRSTRGRRYAMLVTYSYQRIKYNAVEKLIEGKRKSKENIEEIRKAGEKEHGGIEDIAVIRKRLEDCQFTIKPKYDFDPKASDYVDIEKKKRDSILDEIYNDVMSSKYKGDVYLFLWISGHGFYDKFSKDTAIVHGLKKNMRMIYIKTLLCDINEQFKQNKDVRLKILLAVNCCRIELKSNGRPVDARDEPQNVYGCFSSTVGCPSHNSHNPNTTHPSIFGNALVNQIIPNRSIKEAYDTVIKQKVSYDVIEKVDNFEKKKTYILQPEIPYANEAIGEFVF